MKLLPIAAGTIVITGAAVAGAAWYSGERVEKYFEEELQSLSTGGIEVRLLQYERGFFNAEAQTAWTLDDGERVREYLFDHEIQHVPYPDGRLATIRSELQPTPWMRAAFGTSLVDNLALLVYSTVEWNGNHTHALSAETLRGHIEDMDVAWGGFSGVFDFTNDNRHVKGELFAPLLLLRDSSGGGMSIEQLTLELEASREEGRGLWTGPVSLSIDRMHSRDPGDRRTPASFIEIRDLLLTTESTLADDLLDLSGRLSATQTHFSPYTVDDFEMALSLGRLDADAMNALAQTWAELTAARLSPAERQQAIRAALNAQMPQLLSRGPTLELEKLSGTVPEGEFSMHAWLRHHGNGGTDTESLLEALTLTVGVDLPRPFMLQLIAEQQRDTIDMLAAAMYGVEPGSQTYRDLTTNVVYARVVELLELGLIVEKNDRWLSEAEFHNGHLKLNDEPADELMLMLLSAWLLDDATHSP